MVTFPLRVTGLVVTVKLADVVPAAAVTLGRTVATFRRLSSPPPASAFLLDVR